MTLFRLYDILEKKLSQKDRAVLKKIAIGQLIYLKYMLVWVKRSAIPLSQTTSSTLITLSITMTE